MTQTLIYRTVHDPNRLTLTILNLFTVAANRIGNKTLQRWNDYYITYLNIRLLDFSSVPLPTSNLLKRKIDYDSVAW